MSASDLNTLELTHVNILELKFCQYLWEKNNYVLCGIFSFPFFFFPLLLLSLLNTFTIVSVKQNFSPISLEFSITPASEYDLLF